MSVAELISELESLTDLERRDVVQKLQDLADEDEDIQLCSDSADQGAVLMDQLEAEDASSETR